MKNNNSIILYYILILLTLAIGCSSTYQVTTSTSETNHNSITQEAFIEKVRDKNVTVTFVTGQSEIGRIQSLQGGKISLITNHDTLDVQITDIKLVSDENKTLFAIIGFPLGTLFCGVSGCALAQATSDNENKLSRGLSGFAYGSAIEFIAYLAIGNLAPPTTYYEFRSSNKIYEKQHAP